MNLDAVNGLPLGELMKLRVAVNNRITEIEKDAWDCLQHGHPYKGFGMKEGKVSRCIESPKAYEHILLEVLDEDVVFTKTILPLTKAETLVKAQFDKEDAKDILGKLATTYGTKVSKPTMIYTGE
jgi:hypothetical protein